MKNHSCAYRRMMVWDELGTGRIEFDAGDVYREQLGYIVENRTLVGVLHRQLASATHVTRRFGQAATSFTRDPGGYRLQIDGGECWQAAVLVAADGATSRVRQWAGIPGREWDYEHQAIVATVRMGQPHGHCARQRFSEDGPVALLPLVDAEASHCFNSLVWSLVPARANRMMALSEREFAHELECQFELDPGAVTAISARQCLPLRQRHAKNYVQDAVVLVGDAAHTIHPLAGQGVNLGFKDVQTLAALWQHGADKGLPANDPVLLQRYQRERKGDNLLMMAAMEGFKRLFGEAHPMVRMARNVGMDWFNRQPLLKEWLMRQAMGL
jgi:2-octaprenylphenol hydroxylase